MKEILVNIERVYGKDVIYPKCYSAKVFAEIAGTRTLTMECVGKIKRLGYRVTVAPDKDKLLKIIQGG